ncbi:MAG: histidine kinase, partial [Leptospira sp.]|nr:histidine kinase [Leptospira sp.]
WLPQAVFFSSPENLVEIIIHVANFKNLHGGFRQSIEFGKASRVMLYKQNLLALDIFLIGSLFVISLYHLCLFLLRQEDRTTLYFSVYAFLAVLFKITTGEYFIVILFPDLNWEMLIKMIFLSIYLTFPVFLGFVKRLLPEESNILFVRTLQTIFLCMSVHVIVSSVSWIEYIFDYGEILILICCIYILNIFVKAALKRKECALGFLMGFFIFFVTIINDILFENNIIRTEVYSPIGAFLLFFSQAIFLSKKFTKLYSTVEKQKTELEQSADLKEKLYNTNIQSKRMELELIKKTIQPHFLMNSLSTIRYWILESPDKSTDLLDALAGELRVIQEIAGKKHISIMDEFRLCKYHVSVMKMRMEKFYSLRLRGFLGDELLPPLIFHTLLENAFTYEDSGKAKLSFCILKIKNKNERAGNYYCFIVHNHFKKAETNESKKGSGMGMEYVRLRLEESYPGRWSLEHGKSRKGYRVVMCI